MPVKQVIILGGNNPTLAALLAEVTLVNLPAVDIPIPASFHGDYDGFTYQKLPHDVWDLVTYTTMNRVRKQLAKRNCTGRAINKRLTGTELRLRIGWLHKDSKPPVLEFHHWDKVRVLPNHFLGGQRK